MHVVTGEKRRRLIRRHVTLGLGLAAALAVAGWAGLSRHWAAGPWVVAWLAGLSVVCFAYYGYDKRQARAGGPRVPEAALHTLALLGGTAGALAGMYFFRHKTVKASFRIVFFLILALQVALAAYLWKVSAA
jgi:uncharacterized membrane protein YsdA (DUF1294 family)